MGTKPISFRLSGEALEIALKLVDGDPDKLNKFIQSHVYDWLLETYTLDPRFNPTPDQSQQPDPTDRTEEIQDLKNQLVLLQQALHGVTVRLEQVEDQILSSSSVRLVETYQPVLTDYPYNTSQIAALIDCNGRTLREACTKASLQGKSEVEVKGIKLEFVKRSDGWKFKKI